MERENDEFIFTVAIILLIVGTTIANLNFGYMPSVLSIYVTICFIGLGIIIQLGHIIDAIINSKEETND